jgi:hypothetical protein
VVAHGLSAALIEATAAFSRDINSGKRLRSSYQQASHEAGLPLFGERASTAEASPSIGPVRVGGPISAIPIRPFTRHRKPAAHGRNLAPLPFRFLLSLDDGYNGHRGTVKMGRVFLRRSTTMAGALCTRRLGRADYHHRDHGNMEAMNHGNHRERRPPSSSVKGRKHSPKG